MRCPNCTFDLIPLWTYEWRWIRRGKKPTGFFVCVSCNKLYGPPSSGPLIEYKAEVLDHESKGKGDTK